MSKLKIEFGFGVQYRGDGSAILGHEQVAGLEEIHRTAVAFFGGYTRYDTFGAWKDPDTGVVVSEAGCTISVLTSEAQHHLDERVEGMVAQIKRSLQQKAVAVTRSEVLFDIL